MKKDDLIYYRGNIQAELLNVVEFWAKEMFDSKTQSYTTAITNQGITLELTQAKLSFFTGIMYSLYKAAQLYNNPEYAEYAKVAERAIERGFYSDAQHAYICVNDIADDSNFFIQNQALVIEAYSQAYVSERNDKQLSKAMNLFYKVEIELFEKTHSSYLLATLNQLIQAYIVLYNASTNPHVKRSLQNITLYLLELPFNKLSLNSCKDKLALISNLVQLKYVLNNTQQEQILNLSTKIIAETVFNKSVYAGRFIYCPNLVQNNTDSKLVYWDVQLEAILALTALYQWNKEERYLIKAFTIWKKLSLHFIDRKNGEWFYRINEENIASLNDVKCGTHKSPYQITRVLSHLIVYINQLYEN